MKIDYNQAAKTYDNTRQASTRIIEAFDRKIAFGTETKVLDFGCGTGNFIYEIYRRYGAVCFGVEPSDAMAQKASVKSDSLTIKLGDHSHIPFADNFFDFIYMTDVIHHVPDLGLMFSSLNQKLRIGGMACIVTESHTQIAARWYNRYFEGIGDIEKRRYPDVSAIISLADSHSLLCESVEILEDENEHLVEQHFIENVRQKNYSMFRLLDENIFQEGLDRLMAELGKFITSPGGGSSLVWLKHK